MDRRLAKHGFVPNLKEDHLVEMVTGAEIIAVGYAGGSALHLIIESPAASEKKDTQPRAFRRFGLGDLVPTAYRYVGHALVGPEWVFIYERMKA